MEAGLPSAPVSRPVSTPQWIYYVAEKSRKLCYEEPRIEYHFGDSLLFVLILSCSSPMVEAEASAHRTRLNALNQFYTKYTNMPNYNTINLHPEDHSLSDLTTDTFDVICIGSGWAGRTAAARVVKAGLSAVIIESELVGGDCPFWACVPSKVLLRSDAALDDADAVSGAKESLATTKVNADAVFSRRDRVVANWNDGAVLIPLVQSAGASIVRGKASIAGEKRVKVQSSGNEMYLTAREAVVICTGSEVVMPDITGLSDIKPWTPRQATSSSTVPNRLLVLGGGAVGCEMATAYAGFGSKVTMITSGPSLLSKFEQQAGEIIRKSLTSKGVTICLSTSLKSTSRNNEGIVKATLSNGETVEAEEILIAIGRRPTTKDIGLGNFGILEDGSPIPVDESLCVTNVPGSWLYAGGDVNGRHPLTHGSKYHGRIIANAIVARKGKIPLQLEPWGPDTATADKMALPQVVFTSPNVASVGMTEQAAKQAGIAYKAISATTTTIASLTRSDRPKEGWAQWIVVEATGRLIGATLVGDEAGELIHAYTIAIVGNLTLEKMCHAVPSFPTLSEVHLNLLEAAGL